MNTIATPLICKNCGLVLSAPGGRCPSCGALQPGSDEVTQVDLAAPTPPQPLSPSMRPSLRPRTTQAPPKKSRAVWFVAPLLIVLGTTVAIALVRANKFDREEERLRALAAAAPAELAAPEEQASTVSKLSALWLDASSRAKAWNNSAVLIQIEAGPLNAAGELDRSKGSARFEYGIPAPGEVSLPLRTGRAHWVVKVDASGTHNQESQAANGLISVPEPDCLVEDALRISSAATGSAATGSAGTGSAGPGSAAATGDASGARTVRYFWNARADRATWVISDAKQAHTLDGRSCTVIVR